MNFRKFILERSYWCLRTLYKVDLISSRLGNYPSTVMAFKNIIIRLNLLLLLRTASSTSKLEIRAFMRTGNNVQLQCRERHFNDNPATDLLELGLFYFNSTRQSVSSLLDANGINYDFDSDRDGILSFEVHQSIEGYYYCSRNMSSGLPDDEDDYITILG